MSDVPAWINWEGWRWIAPVLAMAIGFYFGWDMRATRERLRSYRERRESRYALVDLLATQKDPRDCPSIDDEIEAFAHLITTAKHLVGDLSEQSGGHPE